MHDLDDLVEVDDLAPIRYRSRLLQDIERLSEERRRLLRSMAQGNRAQGALLRLRLVQINEELNQRWNERRQELGEAFGEAEPE